MDLKLYIKPELKEHGDLKTLTMGAFEGGSDADTGDEIPPPS